MIQLATSATEIEQSHLKLDDFVGQVQEFQVLKGSRYLMILAGFPTAVA